MLETIIGAKIISANVVFITIQKNRIPLSFGIFIAQVILSLVAEVPSSVNFHAIDNKQH